MKTSALRKKSLGAALLLFAISACAQRSVLSPSALNANPAAFQHKTVTVRGYVTLEPEGHNLYESKALSDAFDKEWDSHSKSFNQRSYMKYCLTIANPGLMYRNRETLKGKTLVVTGQFLADYLTPQTIDLGACPLPTAILIDMNDFKHRYGKLLPNP